MKFLRTRLVALAAAVVLSACGGGDDNGFDKLVVFGDSLSDMGTYNVGTIAMVGAQTGGAGRWSINDAKGGQIWVEQLARKLDLPPLCAAETGLSPNLPNVVGQAPAAHAGCTNYAQGSARVSSPLGPNSVALQALGQQTLGFMAKPVKEQMAAHLAAAGGQYGGDDLVTVLAGANDVLMELALTAKTDPEQAVTNAAAAGAELGGLIQSQVLAKGAKRVLVLNLPAIALTPAIQAQGAQVAGLVDTMTKAFNGQLAQSLNGANGVLMVDLYAMLTDMVQSPRQWGLTSVTDVACGPNALSSPPNDNGTALVCNASNLLLGDRSHYLFADDVHPTPWGHQLFMEHAFDKMKAAGWL